LPYITEIFNLITFFSLKAFIFSLELMKFSIKTFLALNETKICIDKNSEY